LRSMVNQTVPSRNGAQFESWPLARRQGRNIPASARQRPAL
jgi:hypothetical protein